MIKLEEVESPLIIYWLSFRFSDKDMPKSSKGPEGTRRTGLIEAIRKISEYGPWESPTSLLLFRSSKPRAEIAATIDKFVDTGRDVVIFGRSGKVKLLSDNTDKSALRKVIGAANIA